MTNSTAAAAAFTMTNAADIATLVAETGKEYIIGRYIEDDGETFLIKTYAKGWYTAVMASDERVEMKMRLKDITAMFPVGHEPELNDDEDEDEEDDEKQAKMASQLNRYRDKYVASITYNGRKSLHNGDAVASCLTYRDLDDVYRIAAMVLNMDEGELRARYLHLNKGSQRMNLGNRIRAAFKRGDQGVVDWVVAHTPPEAE